MYKLKENIFFAPGDGGVENEDKTDDEALSDDVDNESEIEKDKAMRRENYNLRTGKKNAQINAINTKIEKLEAGLTQMMLLVGGNSQSNNSNPNEKLTPEEKQTYEQILDLKSTIQGFISNVDDRFKRMDERSESERKANFRRELLKEAGASTEIIHFVDQGVLNIPEHLYEDFDALDKFLGRLGGIKRTQQTNQQTTSTDQTVTKQAVKSVPHKKDDDTAAVHTDKGRTDLAGALDGINSEIDKLLDGTKSEGGKGIPKESLTKMFELAEKGDAILAGN